MQINCLLHIWITDGSPWQQHEQQTLSYRILSLLEYAVETAVVTNNREGAGLECEGGVAAGRVAIIKIKIMLRHLEHKYYGGYIGKGA